MSNINVPNNTALLNSCKLSIVHDKPIYLNYWTDSQQNEVYIGKNNDGEKMIVRDEEEYTSPIEKLYKIDNAYVVVTANSIYIVSINIQVKQVNLN
tara:strand:- start:3070 stop:3357 length:288 start_codon:yes stop_codon:yes gene_type:complete